MSYPSFLFSFTLYLLVCKGFSHFSSQLKESLVKVEALLSRNSQTEETSEKPFSGFPPFFKEYNVVCMCVSFKETFHVEIYPN